MSEDRSLDKTMAAPSSNSKRLSLPKLSSSNIKEMFKMPGRRLSMALTKRKRDRSQEDDDSVSLQSVDIQSSDLDEPKKKRQSLSFLSPAGASIRAVTSAMKRSASNLSLRSAKDAPAASTPAAKKQVSRLGTPYRGPGPSTPRPRENQAWYLTISHDDLVKLDKETVSRQEAIHELLSGEKDLVKDLHMLRVTYYEPMKKLGILSPADADGIFGNIDRLGGLHEELVQKLEAQVMPDNFLEFVGETILEWAPCLDRYVAYCANQVSAKALLDDRRQNKAVDDFLQRCQESPFSRKLDLWSFLDVPRSRLVKYPLMLKQIIKYTPKGHCDLQYLEQAINLIEDIIKAVDASQGKARCDFIKSRLVYTASDLQYKALINESSVIVCEGPLRNSRNTKLHVFLFEKMFVLTRKTCREVGDRYEMHRAPIPVDDLYLEDDVEGKSGSFRSTFSTSSNDRFYFRVSNGLGNVEYTLRTSDRHDKQQWINSIMSLIPVERQGPAPPRSASRKASRLLRNRPEGQNVSQVSLQNACNSGVKRHGSSVSDTEVVYGEYPFKLPRTSPTASISSASSLQSNTRSRRDPEGQGGSPLGSGISLSGSSDEDESKENESEAGLPHMRYIDSPLWEENDEDERGHADGQNALNESAASSGTLV